MSDLQNIASAEISTSSRNAAPAVPSSGVDCRIGEDHLVGSGSGFGLAFVVSTAVRPCRGQPLDPSSAAGRAWHRRAGGAVSVLATRSFYTPYPEQLAAAHERIAALMAPDGGRRGAQRDEGPARAYHLTLLSRDDSPSLAWTLVALAGFAGWVGGASGWRGVGSAPRTRWSAKTATRAAVLIAVGLLVWLDGGLYKA